jgi:hypothetical protein
MTDDQRLSRPNYFVLEFSPSQKAWHIQHIEDLIQTNLLCYIDQSKPRDYIIMGVAQTHEELHQLREEITKTFNKIHPEIDADSIKARGKMSLITRLLKLFRK